MLARRFVVLALALLLVPASGRALPIEEPGETEFLVEGHTVFMTIDAIQYDEGAAATASARPSQMREPAELASTDGVRFVRSPGVAWFNDQYLTPPRTQTFDALGPDTMRSEYASAMTILVRADDGEGIREPCGGAILAWQQGWDPREIAFDDPTSVTFEEVVYNESYRVTDPNAHAWVVDQYIVYGEYPLWVANLLGAETFVPDTPDLGATLGVETDDCSDLVALDAAGDGASELTCGLSTPGGDADPFHLPTLTDDPCMGYAEPSRSGNCYGGQPASLEDPPSCSEQPRRRHTALLYFDWSDLAPVAFADHCGEWLDDRCSGVFYDTNGCDHGTEWPCPEGAWGLPEGNSHAFHPATPQHSEGEACPTPSWNPVNHGFQLNRTATSPGECSYFHEIAPMNVYYSGDRRPRTPPLRTFVVDDIAGPNAPFVDRHLMFPHDP